MSFYDRLQTETQLQQNYLLTSPIITDVYSGNFDLSTYVAFLHQAYHHVKHTVPLLMQAGARLNDSQSWLSATMGQYLVEEMGHEHWILNDIETCGYDREAYALSAPSYASEMMVSYLYDVVGRLNPVGIFGMIQVLEGTSSSLAPEVGRLVQQKLGLPDEAMTYLRTHGELDQDHIAFFKKVMNKIESIEDQNAIIHVANNVYRLYGDVYRSIADEAASTHRQAA